MSESILMWFVLIIVAMLMIMIYLDILILSILRHKEIKNAMKNEEPLKQLPSRGSRHKKIYTIDEEKGEKYYNE